MPSSHKPNDPKNDPTKAEFSEMFAHITADGQDDTRSIAETEEDPKGTGTKGGTSPRKLGSASPKPASTTGDDPLSSMVLEVSPSSAFHNSRAAEDAAIQQHREEESRAKETKERHEAEQRRLNAEMFSQLLGRDDPPAHPPLFGRKFTEEEQKYRTRQREEADRERNHGGRGR